MAGSPQGGGDGEVWDPEGCLDKVRLALEHIKADSADSIHLEGDKLNKVDDRAVGELVVALRDTATVTHLDLSLNSVTDAGAAGIADLLGGNTTLLNLELDGNLLSNDAASSLCDALGRNTTLTRLDLSNNPKIDDQGAQKLAGMLKLNTSLQYLHLRSCRIGNQGVEHLCTALLKNTTLQGLYLSGNIANDSVTPAVCELLRQNCSLTELGLANNELSEPGVKDLIKGLEANEYVTKFHLSASGGKRLKGGELERLLQRNRAHMVARLSDIQRARDEVRHEYEARINAIRQEHAGEVAQLRAEVAELRRGR